MNLSLPFYQDEWCSHYPSTHCTYITVASSIPRAYQRQEALVPNHCLEELRHEHAGVYSYLMECVRHDEKRRLLAALVNHSGATYDQLDAATGFSRRSTREHCYDLRDKGVVEITDSNIAFVSFRSEEIALLAEDALSFFF